MKRRVRRGKVSLTQYLESQEDQNMTKLLNFNKTQERGRDEVFLCALAWRRSGGLYSSSGGNMNGMSFNEGWQRIMNLDLILAWGKYGVLNVEIGGSEEQEKFGFPVATITACRGNFKKKKKSYFTQFWLELSRSCAQIETSDV